MNHVGGDFISEYMDYVGETETPKIYHRWCCLSMIGAYLGRQFSLRFGHSHLHPNLYVMLIGTPGARKSTAIKISKKIITSAGYDYISADRTSKEKFLLDLAGEGENGANDLTDLLDANLWGEGNGNNTTIREMYIACDEFNDFIGTGNIEFISMLGNLWDFEGVYENRIKTGKSVAIYNPTISIIGGNTPVNFARAFPSEILGQGFFSRLLLIHGEPTGKKITFPAIPTLEATNEITRRLQEIKLASYGVAEISRTGQLLLDKIYTSWRAIDDTRFESYSNRRLPHLLKLCLVLSAARMGTEVSEQDIIYGNTILTHAENLMPKALGEFGKSRNSDITHKIMGALNLTDHPVTLKEMWELLHKDLEKINDLAELMRNLVTADKIFAVQGGFLAKKKVLVEVNSNLINYELLTTEEREMAI